jgi:hypothetical protein
VTGRFCQDSGFSRWRGTVEELEMDFNLKGTESKQGRQPEYLGHGLGNDDSNVDSQA